MLKLKSTICTALLGALAFAPGVQAGGGGFPHNFVCEEGESSSTVKDYFCDGSTLFEVTVNCQNLDTPVAGALGVNPYVGPGPTGVWGFLVRQNTDDVSDDVCEANGWYGDSLKTELKCTDAPTGSNKGKPGKGNEPIGYDQANFEIKNLGYSADCDI